LSPAGAVPIAAWITASCLTAWTVLTAAPEPYPARTVRILVGFGPGSAADTVARLVARHLEKTLLQPVVENRPGNSSMTAADSVSHAPSDGNTLFMATVANTISPATTGARFNLGTDLAPVALLGVVAKVLVAHPSVPANDLKELVALARAKPESLAFGTSGAATASHLAAALRTGAKTSDGEREQALVRAHRLSKVPSVRRLSGFAQGSSRRRRPPP
jgi:tripartite-type tricarboxylate transporter receptor subunit TctC